MLVNKSQKFTLKENGVKLSNFANYHHHGVTMFDNTKVYPNVGVENSEVNGNNATSNRPQDFQMYSSRERLYTELNPNHNSGLPVTITSSASSDIPRT